MPRRASVLESAATQYEKAATAFGAAGRLEDRGQAELAIAAIDYYELSEWTRSASWAEKAAATYGLDTRDILVEVGRRRMVGGQEDMIIDVALDLVHQREHATAP